LNNGVLLLVAVEDRQSRIEIGYGLEGALPDAKTGAIQDEYMLPYFQKGDYDQGILNGYLALTAVVAKEYNVEFINDAKPAKTHAVKSKPWWEDLPWWAKFAAAALIVLFLFFDWVFLGGNITLLLLSLLRFRGGGGGGGGGYGGGSGGGGGSNRNW
ncbi:MAG: TPM domain-containing protein, partial [Pelosinus sp.]|nr:TPM domain-containing protein [Pelosinus sp.]